MNIDKLLDELIILLDNNPDVKKIDELKKQIDDNLLTLIHNYRLSPTVDNKKKLYENTLFKEYIQCESNINYLIMAINNKFKRGKICENHKW